MVIQKWGRLSLVEYKSNGIERLVGPLVLITPTNITLDLSDNEISCIAEDFLAESAQLGSSIVKAFFARNRLAYQLEIDVYGRTFRSFANLTELDLSSNAIKSLPVHVFSRLTVLEKLNLSGNSLRLLDFEFRHMSRLQVLDLSNNLLTTFNGTVRDHLSAMFHSNHTELVVDLSGNPFQCSCETESFLHWIANNRNKFVNYDRYSCYLNGTYVEFTYLSDRILVELSYACSKRLALIISGLMLGLGLALLCTAICLYRYRWEVRYWCLWLTQRTKKYQLLFDEKSDYEYDAFVIYDSSDRVWVNEYFVPALEDINEDDGTTEVPHGSRRKLRLCVHERDFPIGSDIIGSIWTLMEKSRMVILIISPGFTRSQYCDYEMNLARMQSVEKGRNLFIPIILEQPPMESMSDGLRWIVRKLTYIEWPREEHREDDRKVFWENVRKAVDGYGLAFNFRRNV